tara:strand:- start:1377 stop:3050 length:1674 start_codon:yes stop_codon:yes gene_type:complete
MADQIKQLGYHRLTTAEISAGTRVDIVTTSASQNYVIRAIESRQLVNADPITAEATIGLTSGVATDDYVSLGTVAQANRLGVEGNEIMPDSSTLSIRPTAKSIPFIDDIVFDGQNYDASYNYATKVNKVTKVSVAGTAEPTLASDAVIDKSSTTFATGTGYSQGNYPNNYTIHHTNANGLNLMLMFHNGSSSTCGFDLWNSTTGVYYGAYYSSYDRPFYDGERYVFWVYNGGSTDTRIRWIDLDESATNLEAANTLGGSSGGNYYHGETAVAPDSPTHGNRASYDNHLNAFYKNRHTDGKRYLMGYSWNNGSPWIYEIPDTLTNDSGTTPAPRWQYLAPNGTGSNNGTDPFGNNAGYALNMVSSLGSYYSSQSYQNFDLIYDKDVEGGYYLLYWDRGSLSRGVFAWTPAQMEAGWAAHGPMIDQYGLRAVSTASADKINVNAGGNSSYGNYSLQIDFSNYLTADMASLNTGYTLYALSSTKHYFKNNNTGDYEIYHFNPKFLGTDVTQVTSNSDNLNGRAIEWFVCQSTPSASTIASRTYTATPGAVFRVTGILSDQ